MTRRTGILRLQYVDYGSDVRCKINGRLKEMTLWIGILYSFKADWQCFATKISMLE